MSQSMCDDPCDPDILSPTTYGYLHVARTTSAFQALLCKSIWVPETKLLSFVLAFSVVPPLSHAFRTEHQAQCFAAHMEGTLSCIHVIEDHWLDADKS